MSTFLPVPEQLKQLNLYLQRAVELATKEPVVAYFCKYYAAKLAIDSPHAKDPECQTFLLGLLDALEEDKHALEGEHEDALVSDTVGYSVVENFALRIFLNADNEDRAGNASKKTAKTFLAASIFLEVLKVFGEMDTDITEKIRYAKFKAADIIKAIKEGRTPHPGPPGSDAEGVIEEPIQQQQWLADHENGAGLATVSAETSAPAPIFIKSPMKVTPATSMPIFPESLDGEDEERDPFAIDQAQLMSAQKFARYAVSALQYDDITTAVQNLEKVGVVEHVDDHFRGGSFRA